MPVQENSWTIQSNLGNVITGVLRVGEKGIFPATGYPLTVDSALPIQAQIAAFCAARGWDAASAATEITNVNTAAGFPVP